jgi:hypothetical protein
VKKKLLRKTAALFGATAIRLIGATVRVEIDDPARFLQQHNRGPVIFAFWHNRLFLMPYLYRRFQPGRKLAALISASGDGDVIAEIIARLGLESVRGSSSKKGSTALLSMIRLLNEEKKDIAITPDGPRGPRYELQPGVFQVAQSTGCPIIPLSYELKKKKELPSWDRFQIPFPWTTCYARIGHPVFIPAGASPSEMEQYSSILKKELKN